MNVKQLIKQLSKLDPKLPVVYYDYTYGECEVQCAKITSSIDFYDEEGKPINPPQGVVVLHDIDEDEFNEEELYEDE